MATQLPILAHLFSATASTFANGVFWGLEQLSRRLSPQTEGQDPYPLDVITRNYTPDIKSLPPQPVNKTYAARVFTMPDDDLDPTEDGLILVNPEDISYVRDILKNPRDYKPEDKKFASEILQKMLEGDYKALPDPNAIKDSDPDDVKKKKLNTNVLSPLQTVFLNDEIIDKTLISLGIPELLDGKASLSSGCILNGPPGTGKTILVRAIAKIYENMGCYTKEINLAKISEKWISSKGNNLDKEIAEALAEARKTKRPAFIFLDEATAAIMKVIEGSNVKDQQQEALDVLKKYIGNYPELIFAITTNGKTEEFDDAVVRDGRLDVHKIDYPQMPEKIRMWEHFIRTNNVIDDLKPEQYKELANAFPKKYQGASIEKFCKKILMLTALKNLKAQGYNNVKEALMGGISMSAMMKEVRAKITYADILESAKKVEIILPEEDKEITKKKPPIGFGSATSGLTITTNA